MDQKQQEAINFYKTELCESLLPEVIIPYLCMKNLLHNEECQVILHGAPSDRWKILKLLDVIKWKLGSWELIIEFLRGHSYGWLADNLEIPATREREQIGLVDFINRLIDFYDGNFRSTETFGEQPEPIESVWVDLKLEGTSHTTCNYEEIFIRMQCNKYKLVLVKGDPGSGKTTLVKKIAYDWAQQQLNKAETIRYGVVLAVPLRLINSGPDLLKMAVGYFLSINAETAEMSEIVRICAALRKSKLKVLILLDGLDEHQAQPKSVLEQIFGSALTPSQSRLAPIQFDFDVLITSRPYACRVVNENIMYLKYEIVGFTEEKQTEFLHNRCKTELGRKRTAEYLDNSEILVEIRKIPILLLLVCFLADQDESIPTSLTQLYQTFVLRMLERANKKGFIGDFEQDKWKKSELVKSLGCLALLGVVKNRFLFSKSEAQICAIATKDSYASGLLLSRSDQNGFQLKSEFPHRSIQEFFAALYSVEFWSKGTLTEATGWPTTVYTNEATSKMTVEMLPARLLHFSPDSQFARFYFGLISGQSQFETKLRSSLTDAMSFYHLQRHFILCLSQSLSDCSDIESFKAGEIVRSLVDANCKIFKLGFTNEQRNRHKTWLGDIENSESDISPSGVYFRAHLKSGMKLAWIAQRSFYIESSVSQTASLLWVWRKDVELIMDSQSICDVKRIEWLLLDDDQVESYARLQNIVRMVKVLPHCRNCIIIGSNDLSKVRISVANLIVDTEKQSQANSTKSVAIPAAKEFLLLQIGQKFCHSILGYLTSKERDPECSGFELMWVIRESESLCDVKIAMKQASIAELLQLLVDHISVEQSASDASLREDREGSDFLFKPTVR